MDLGKIIEATETITFEFLGEKNTAEIYTAGISRLTAEQFKAFRDGNEPSVVQAGIPAIVKSWDVVWNGEPLALDSLTETDEAGKFVYPIPLAFANSLWEKAEGVMYGRPTEASESPAGLQLTENVQEPTAIQ